MEEVRQEIGAPGSGESWRYGEVGRTGRSGQPGWAGRGGPGGRAAPGAALGCGWVRTGAAAPVRPGGAGGAWAGPPVPVPVPGPGAGAWRMGAAPGRVCGRVQPVCGGKSAAMPSMDSGPYPTEPTGIRDLVASMTLAVHTGPKPPHSSMS